MFRPFLAVLASAALAACNAAAPPPSSSTSGVTPSTFSLPGGSGCAGEVARFQAIIDNDLATGHTTKSVHGRMSADMTTARATCAAGNEAGAVRQVAATKARFGYR